MTSQRPITFTLAALGGQGGGVVQEWMIHVAESANYIVQATSVPGVAQRTGATIYYMEFYRGHASADEPAGIGVEQTPVMALMPAPGNCDLVVAAELVEAARMVQRGIVDADLTTLVTSTHRSYTIDEKSHLGDGRADQEELMDLVNANTARCISFDMQAIATQHNSVISAAILGAIAGAGVLPFSVDAYETAITESGRAVATNLAAFRAALQAATQGQDTDTTPIPEISTTRDERLADLPASVAEVAAHALPRLEDYQDTTYVDEYLALLKPFLEYSDRDHAVAAETARGLALWMTFEDTIRVADLKTRPQRLRARLTTSGGDDKLVYVTEFMKPRPEEIAGTMPARLGAWLEKSAWAHQLLKPFTQGLKIHSTSVPGYLTLRALARLKPWRRSTLRFAREWSELEQWLDLVSHVAATDQAAARELAACQQLIKGYGETHANGLQRYRTIAANIEQIMQTSDPANTINALRQAALAEDTGQELIKTLQAFDIQQIEEAA